MEMPEPVVMQKETVIKEDGRRLIYYRFLTIDPTVTTEPPSSPEGEG